MSPLLRPRLPQILQPAPYPFLGFFRTALLPFHPSHNREQRGLDIGRATSLSHLQPSSRRPRPLLCCNYGHCREPSAALLEPGHNGRTPRPALRGDGAHREHEPGRLQLSRSIAGPPNRPHAAGSAPGSPAAPLPGPRSSASGPRSQGRPGPGLQPVAADRCAKNSHCGAGLGAMCSCVPCLHRPRAPRRRLLPLQPASTPLTGVQAHFPQLAIPRVANAGPSQCNVMVHDLDWSLLTLQPPVTPRWEPRRVRRAPSPPVTIFWTTCCRWTWTTSACASCLARTAASRQQRPVGHPATRRVRARSCLGCARQGACVLRTLPTRSGSGRLRSGRGRPALAVWPVCRLPALLGVGLPRSRAGSGPRCPCRLARLFAGGERMVTRSTAAAKAGLEQPEEEDDDAVDLLFQDLSTLRWVEEALARRHALPLSLPPQRCCKRALHGLARACAAAVGMLGYVGRRQEQASPAAQAQQGVQRRWLCRACKCCAARGARDAATVPL